MNNINLLDSENIKNIHFIGIGGISMSGLAEILIDLGYNISGSDLNESNLTKKLSTKNIKVSLGHSAENINNHDLVVYTAAVKKDNPEYIAATEQGIPTMERSELLGQIMKKYKYSINIAGTHGKTTTTSMLSVIMMESNKNPTIHVGGELQAIGGNTKIGSKEYFVTEACEYVDSFLKFHPFMAVILNIEADHLDYFKNLDDVMDSFSKFIKLIPNNGYLILCADDENTMQLSNQTPCKKITYGVQNQKAHWTAKGLTYDEFGYPSYKLCKDGEELAKINLNILGVHNVKNSLAAIAAAHTFGCDIDSIKKAFHNFKGPKRRFEIKGTKNNVKVVDDYAHHPTEIQATLSAAKNGSYNSIWCIFQPHTYTRTKELLDDFSQSFYSADNIIITDIYAEREKDRGDIHAKDLAAKITTTGTKAHYIDDFEEIANYLDDNVNKGDLIITLGAGDIYKVGELFLENS